MKFCWSTLNVKNMDESLKFYQDIVGLNIINKMNVGSDTQIVFLGDGDTKIELIHNTAKVEINAGSDISWGFETESLDKLISLLKENGYEYTGPFQPNPRVEFVFVSDPNGMKVQFVQNL